MKKVVINVSYGGFELSLAAAEWLYERGMLSVVSPADCYFTPPQLVAARAEWRAFNADPEPGYCGPVFTNDEKFVFETHGMTTQRDNPLLVECVETLGADVAGASGSELHIVEIPDDVGNNWHIVEYDGMEHVAENHRTWA